MPDDDNGFRVLFGVALAAGVAALLLIGLYYWKHPDRRMVEDFTPRHMAPRAIRDAAAPAPPSDQGGETDTSTPPGSEAGAA